jgi:acyl-CoA thioesterase-1
MVFRMNKFKTLGVLCAITTGLFGGPTRAWAEPVAIVALGDSLTAGFGLPPGESFPEQLETALKARGHDVTVNNAGVSGDTASDGLARLEWSVPASADIVIVELGGNDAMRGIDPALTREALSAIVAKLKGRGQSVLLAGMRAPPNLGDAYAAQFDSIYPDIAAEYGVPLYAFFLEGVALDALLNQPDGIHPTAAGVATIVGLILPDVEKLIAATAATD